MERRVGGGGGAARRGPGRKGGAGHFASLGQHSPNGASLRRLLRAFGGRRRSPLSRAPFPSREVLQEPLAHLFKAAATISAPRSAPPVPPPRLPRPRSFQPLANRRALSVEVPTPSICCVQSETSSRESHASALPRARVSLPARSREPPKGRSAPPRLSARRSLLTHAREQPQASREWKATPPCVLAQRHGRGRLVLVSGVRRG